jgi:hypothetical protein
MADNSCCRNDKTCHERWQDPTVGRSAVLLGWTLPSSFAPMVGLPELCVEHYFFEIVVIQVRRGAEDPEGREWFIGENFPERRILRRRDTAVRWSEYAWTRDTRRFRSGSGHLA